MSRISDTKSFSRKVPLMQCFHREGEKTLDVSLMRVNVVYQGNLLNSKLIIINTVHSL